MSEIGHNHNMNIREQIVQYIKSLSPSDRSKLERMVKHDVMCCAGLAKRFNVAPDVINAELKDIF